MLIHTLLPPVDLAPLIDRFWGWEHAHGAPLALPILPPGVGAELYLHWHDDAPFVSADGPLPMAHLLCLRQQALPLQPAARLGFVAVRFRIGQVRRLLPQPAAELLDQAHCIETLWGARGRQLARTVASADNFAQRVAHLVAFFRGIPLQGDALIAAGMQHLYQQGGQLDIDTLANRLGLGRRQLERRWLRHCGQRPAQTRQLIRFHHTIRALLLNPQASPLATALTHGFYDQAHFIHDLRQRLGCTPSEFLRDARTRTHFYNVPQQQDGTLARFV